MLGAPKLKFAHDCHVNMIALKLKNISTFSFYGSLFISFCKRLGYERLGYVRLGYVRLGYVRLGYVRLGYIPIFLQHAMTQYI